MNWRAKAKVQNLIALLPSPFSYAAYYWLQRHFGALRNPNPVEYLTAGIATCKRIEKAGRSPVDGAFLEVGTGRTINIPLAFWLMGARRTVTVDLNPYLKEELIREDLEYIRENPREIEGMFGDRMHADRLNSLLSFLGRPWRLKDLLHHCAIEYVAPASAGNLALPPESIDFHTSYAVLEHIPKPVIREIIEEGNRIVRSGGLLVHRIDYSDHFSYSDRAISPINFLQYSDEVWDRIAGNRYMYVNRLRVDDFLGLFEQSGQEILSLESYEDNEASALLKNGGISIDKRFADKTTQVLATIGSWIVSQRRT